MQKRIIYAREGIYIKEYECSIDEQKLIYIKNESLFSEYFDLNNLIMNILSSEDAMQLSCAINNLLNYKCRSTEDIILLKDAIGCISINKENKTFNVSNNNGYSYYETNIEHMPYYSDNNSVFKEMDNFPNSSFLKNG